MTIIPATPVHVQAISDIENDSYSTPWSYENIAVAVCDTNMINYAAVNPDGTLAGYAFMRHSFEIGHIENIAVAHNHRGKGIASLLMDTLFTQAQKRSMEGITLEVRQGNRAAMALYHKYGFKVEGYRRGYYKDPTEDAVIMRSWRLL
ncbi:MAG: ribosomal protein S18-alanine N-acetyltransferase [Defluviitaleaceae bacterium]|nr:ribosomal protein S18-alanine N-acetyltransferase [Defluviitaleaceae bacterium]MCL2273601.1 ribosomal protein S18-alanine N-acetyltransferase [Defluviitaleaceae bacterium]